MVLRFCPVEAHFKFLLHHILSLGPVLCGQDLFLSVLFGICDVSFLFVAWVPIAAHFMAADILYFNSGCDVKWSLKFILNHYWNNYFNSGRYFISGCDVKLNLKFILNYYWNNYFNSGRYFNSGCNRASLTAGLIQVVNMDDLTGEELRIATPFIWFFDSAWIKLSNDGSPFLDQV